MEELEALYGAASQTPEETFVGMLQDMGWSDDGFAADLLWQGWFDPDVNSDRRAAAREAWFDYTGMGTYDFDWDQWREWYGEGVKA